MCRCAAVSHIHATSCAGASATSPAAWDALYSVQTAVFLPAPATVSHQDDSPLLWRKAATESNTLTCDVCADDLAMPTELQCLIAEMNWDV